MSIALLLMSTSMTMDFVIRWKAYGSSKIYAGYKSVPIASFSSCVSRSIRHRCVHGASDSLQSYLSTRLPNWSSDLMDRVLGMELVRWWTILQRVIMDAESSSGNVMRLGAEEVRF